MTAVQLETLNSNGSKTPYGQVVLVNPTTGVALDPTEASLVKIQDSLAISGSATSAATLFTQDMDGYESISLQVTAAGTSCTITYETCEDNSTWSSVLGRNELSTSSQLGSTSTSTGIYVFEKVGRYFRARVSTYGSGTVTVIGHAREASKMSTVTTQTRPLPANGTGFCPTNARVQSAASTNATSVKGSSGVLNHVIVSNNHATNMAYIKFYNKATAPTVGTDTPIWTLALPPRAAAIPVTPPTGISFSTGIAYAITLEETDAGTTAVAASQVTGILGYS